MLALSVTSFFSPVHAPVRSVPSRPSHQNTKTPLRRLAKHPIPFSLILEGSLTHQDLPGVWQIAATSKSGTVLCWQHSAVEEGGLCGHRQAAAHPLVWEHQVVLSRELLANYIGVELPSKI